MKPEAKVAHQEFRVDQNDGNKKRYNGSTMSLSEYNELNKRKPDGYYINIYKKFQTLEMRNDFYIPECVINAECIGLDNISYLSPLCIKVLKQMYKEGEVDSSNLLVQRFCPELIADLNQNDARNVSNDNQGSSFSSIKNFSSCLLPSEPRSRIYEEPYKPEEIDVNPLKQENITPTTSQDNLRTGF